MKTRLIAAVCTTAVALFIARPGAQDRLKGMPGYDQFTKMQPLIQGAVVSGAAQNIQWADDGKALTYAAGGKTYKFDITTRASAESGDAAPAAGGGRQGGGRAAGAGAGGGGGGRAGAGGQAPPTGGGRSGGMEQSQSEMSTAPVDGCPPLQTQTARGRQAYCIASPDQKFKAFYRDRNLWVANFDGSGERQVTADGSVEKRIKYGTGSWVYGEELGQTTAIWWSPNSAKVGFYRFDEGLVKDFYVQMNQTQIQDTVDIEAFPKAGAANPIADILVYDVASAKTTTIDARDGKPFDNAVVGHYVYGAQWTQDSAELLMQRANRRQQIVEFIACGPSTGKCRVIVHEEWLTGWLNAGIDPRFNPSFVPKWLKDGKRFIWESERNGWKNFYLYDLTGKLLNAVTTLSSAEAGAIVKIDETAGVVFYTARDGESYLKVQLHRVGLDGKGDARLTDPKFTHTVPAAAISADNKYFVDVYQTHDQPPATQFVDATSGRVLAQLAKSDLTKYDQAGFKKAQQFSYLAADKKTTLYGQISFPSNFDPAKKYPTLVSVYGGPVLQSSIPAETFVGPNATTEYGFLSVLVSYRGVPGTGKRAADALYMHLGVAEMDDMAEGVKALWNRPYFDKARVGISGTSYGGYTSSMQILRHPEVFSAASASSPTSDWRNYDSIYTERYMWIPEENKAGYDAGNTVTYAKDLRGRLLLYYGTADNNVHQNHSMQLIQALQRNQKSFELQVGPDQPHTGVNGQRMMEFFIENLVMHPERLIAPEK
jgi:dipeptidyl-peptidase-4